MPEVPSFRRDCRSLLALFLILAAVSLTVGCSHTPTPVPQKQPDWYQITEYQGKPFYVTRKTIQWTSGRQHADFGRWIATSVYHPEVFIKAERNQITISAGYGWDGVTGGKTVNSMIVPTLFHDALLHAKMNGAPVARSRADLAFYDLMMTQQERWAGFYYRMTRWFGWCFAHPEYPRTLHVIVPSDD